MSAYTIAEVRSKRDLMRFIEFPDKLYKGCPQYVPALHDDQYHSLTDVPTAKYCPHKMWLALDRKGEIAGRICGMINPRYNEYYQKKRARFGWFDCKDDFQVAELLLDTAEAWARSQGMNEIHGPLYYNTLGKQGMLFEGYENIPPFNCLYNYPYYNEFVTRLGYENECDWVQYKMSADQIVSDKVVRMGELLKTRYNLHDADIDTLKKDPATVRKFFKVYNDSFSVVVYNFVPFTDEEIDAEAASVMPYLNNDTSIVLLDDKDEIVAFAITFPSISKALQKARGRLFPTGWYHLLRAIKVNDTVDLMLNGATPGWQNTGISAVYFSEMSTKLKSHGIHYAITNPQIDGNVSANTWKKYDHEPYMRRRCYIKSI